MRSLRDGISLGYRHGAALLSSVSGASRRALRARRGRLLVLMYHRVVGDDERVASIDPAMFVRASTFDRHVAWLAERWRLRTLGQALADPPGADDPPVAVITFDDGWRDNLTRAWPILARRRAPATIFVVSGWAAAGRTDDGEFVRPDELRALAEAGLEIGAHSVSHPRLSRLSRAEAEAEMRGSREAIESWTGAACAVFAYPYGDHDPPTADLARQLFSAAVLAGGGWCRPGGDPARLPRVGIHEDMTSTRPLLASRLARARG